MFSHSTFECFGLVLHGYTADETLRRVDQNAQEGRQTMIVTANPEILLAARASTAYWNVLHQADMRVIDGVALQFAGWISGANPSRLTGVDLAESLLHTASERGWKVALIGGDPGNADRAVGEIRKRFPALSLFAERGGAVTRDGSDDETGENMLFRLTQFAPNILLVGFGHPKQEMWLARHLQDLPSVCVAIGVGGAIDYWSGAKRRAPVWMRIIGIEWVWRLIQEPHRWNRILRATVLFPFTFVWSKLVG